MGKAASCKCMCVLEPVTAPSCPWLVCSHLQCALAVMYHCQQSGITSHCFSKKALPCSVCIMPSPCNAVLLTCRYEYLGNGARLVVTPLTDRIYITATQACWLSMGTAPAGAPLLWLLLYVHRQGPSTAICLLQKLLLMRSLLMTCSPAAGQLPQCKVAFQQLGSTQHPAPVTVMVWQTRVTFVCCHRPCRNRQDRDHQGFVSAAGQVHLCVQLCS